MSELFTQTTPEDSESSDRSAKNDVQDSLLQKSRPLHHFLMEEIPPIDYTLPFLPRPGICMLYGPRGCGKSWIAASLAVSLASGEPFLHWTPSGPQNVLFIDGEMPEAVIQDRFKKLVGSEPFEGVLNLLPLSDLRIGGQPLNLMHAAHRDHLLNDIIATALKGSTQVKLPDCIILDNVSSLFAGIDENSAQEWSEVNQWLVRLRDLEIPGERRGLSILLVHHTGKDLARGSRGSSAQESHLDSTIFLNPRNPDGRNMDVTWQVGKDRHGKVEPKRFNVALSNPGGRLKLVVGRCVEARVLKILEALQREGHLRSGELNEAVEGGRSSIQAALKKAVTDGLVAKPEKWGGVYILTPEGEEVLANNSIQENVELSDSPPL